MPHTGVAAPDARAGHIRATLSRCWTLNSAFLRQREEAAGYRPVRRGQVEKPVCESTKSQSVTDSLCSHTQFPEWGRLAAHPRLLQA